MSDEGRHFRMGGLVVLLLAGTLATFAGRAEAGQGMGFSAGLHGRGVVTGAPAHPGFARAAPAHRFGLHRHGLRHRFAFDHRFPFRHCFAFGDCFGAFAGLGFDDPFFDPQVADTEVADPAGPVGPSPSAPPAGFAEEQDQEPPSAHIVQFHHPQPAGRREGSGRVVVMRPGFPDEVVTVPRDPSGG